MHSYVMVPKVLLPEVHLRTTFASKQSKEHQHFQDVVPIF